MLGRHGADNDVAAIVADAFQVRNAGKVDQMRGRGQPQLHHRDEAMAAGERTALLA